MQRFGDTSTPLNMIKLASTLTMRHLDDVEGFRACLRQFAEQATVVELAQVVKALARLR
jgi:hypothetical protein